MKIKRITLRKIQIPMVSSFTTSFGTIAEKTLAIVEVETKDGHIGWGESATLPFPLYKSETTDTCLLALKDYIAPLVINKEFKTVNQLLNFLTPVKGYHFAKTGLETAVWMILSQKKNKSLSELLGGTKKKIPVGSSIGIDNVKNTLNEIALKLKSGRQRIKLKIKPKWDIKLIEAVRKEFGSIPLMVDANSAYTFEDIDLLKALDKYGLTMIEQPLADDDIIDHSVLQEHVNTPICLDESIHSSEDARKALYLWGKAGKLRKLIINIKPGRVGGLLESKRIHDLCKKEGVGVWCGGMLETSIGRAFNIAIASLSGFIYPNDMSQPNLFYKDDLVKSSYIIDEKGYIKVPQKPGLGFEVDYKKISKYTIVKKVID